MENILYISWTKIIDRDLKFRNIKILENKYKVTYLDISQICFDVKTKSYSKSSNLKVIKIDNFKKLKEYLYSKKFKLILNFTGIHKKKNEIYKLLIGLNTPIVNILEFGVDKSIFFPYNLLFYLKNFFLIFSGLFNKDKEYFILTGLHSRNSFLNLTKKIIYLHSFEYEFLKRNKIKSLNKGKIVCFLDQGLGVHPDFLSKNKKILNFMNRNKKKYNILQESQKLNFLFKIFKQNGYKVYFLQHPKLKNQNNKFYNNCKIIKNKTPQYIAKSKIVISFGSESTQYAIILKKKIIFLKNSEIKNYPDNFEYLEYLEKFFGKNCLNLDELGENKNIKSLGQILKFIVNPSIKYKKFIDLRCYHPKSSKKHTFKEIFENLANN